MPEYMYDDNSFGEHYEEGRGLIDNRPWCDRHGLMASAGDGHYYCEDCELERRWRKRFTLVVTFDGNEDNECLDKVQESIAYLRDHGWTVEESGG